MLLLAFYSCDKESIVDANISEQESVNENFGQRSYSQKDLLWLSDFQQSLQNMQNENHTNSIYSLDDAAFGIEWLFNYTLADNILGLSKGGESSTFNIPNNDNWLELYNQVENQVYSEIANKPHLEFHYLFITVLEEENQIEVATNFKLITPEITEYFSMLNNRNESADCENPPFDNDQFYLGFGGENGIVDLSFCDIEFNNPCNAEGLCSIPDLFALEAVENIHNFNTTNNLSVFCKGGNERVSFSNINEIFFGQTEGFEFFELLRGCNPPIQDTNIRSCDCIPSETLNCMFCVACDVVDDQFESIINTLPAGTQIIDVDFLVDGVYAGGQTWFSGYITYAQVECVPNTITQPDVPPLDIAIICC